MSEKKKNYLDVVCTCGNNPHKTLEVDKNIIRTIIKMEHHGPIPLMLADLEGGGLVGIIVPLPRTITIRFPFANIAWEFLQDLYLSMEVNDKDQIYFILREKTNKEG